jgi:hypothetical protein
VRKSHGTLQYFFLKIFFLKNLICHYGSRLRDFWYEAQKKQKHTRENNGLQGWNDMAVWREQKKEKKYVRK